MLRVTEDSRMISLVAVLDLNLVKKVRVIATIIIIVNQAYFAGQIIATKVNFLLEIPTVAKNLKVLFHFHDI